MKDTVNIPDAAQTALTTLERAGYEAYLVGGCVRDALLGRNPSDWDITTEATPEAIESVFSGFRLIETGIKHGTVTVLIGGTPIEITPYRVDGSYSDHRRPDEVVFTRNLTEDLARRDFTVNAMAYHPQRGLIDPFGGEEDLNNNILRCVGEADRRFNEDALRILRGMRFMSAFGFDADAATDASMRKNIALLRFVSAERIRVEMTKLLMGDGARKTLLAYPEIVTFVIPELKDAVGFAQHNHWHDLDVYAHILKTVENVPKTPALRWAALLHDCAKPVCNFTDEEGEMHFYNHAAFGADMAYRVMMRLKFDNTTRDVAVHLIRHHMDTPFPTEKNVRRAVLRCGAAHFTELLDLQRADALALTADGLSPRTEPKPLSEETVMKREASLKRVEQTRRLFLELMDKPHCFSVNELAVDGDALRTLGFNGADIGLAKETLLWAVADGKVINETEALLAYLKHNGIKKTGRKK